MGHSDMEFDQDENADKTSSSVGSEGGNGAESIPPSVSCEAPESALDFKAGASSKRRVAKELFPNKGKKALKYDESPRDKDGAIVPLSFNSFNTLPLLPISQITNSVMRFAFEGKVLNVYGTFKTPKDYKKYLKADLADREGFGTITLVVSEGFISKFLEKIEVNACLRIEGVNVVQKNANDGGTATYSLHVDATTIIIKAEPFDVCLMFVPEIKICQYLLKASHDPTLKGTIAFVVIQVDKVLKSGGVGNYEQLTIADGPRPMDLATLSFVTQRKSVYHDIVAQFQKGNIVMYVARNIGVFKDKFNTLSILDITLLTPVFGDKRKHDLEYAFRTQISEMGYGQEVYGTLEITNFNGTFIVKKCDVCKGRKVNKLVDGGFCFECGKAVEIIEVPALEGRITSTNSTCIDVTLVGDSVDKVLQLEDSLVNLYNKNIILTNVLLSEIAKVGNFLIDKQGCVIGFNASSTTS